MSVVTCTSRLHVAAVAIKQNSMYATRGFDDLLLPLVFFSGLDQELQKPQVLLTRVRKRSFVIVKRVL